MSDALHVLRHRFAQLPNVEIDDEWPINELGGFNVDSTLANCCVGVFATEGHVRSVTIAMDLEDVRRTGMIASRGPNNQVNVSVNADLVVVTRQVTTQTNAEVLYYEIRILGLLISEQRQRDCDALITTLFQRMWAHEMQGGV